MGTGLRTAAFFFGHQVMHLIDIFVQPAIFMSLYYTLTLPEIKFVDYYISASRRPPIVLPFLGLLLGENSWSPAKLPHISLFYTKSQTAYCLVLRACLSLGKHQGSLGTSMLTQVILAVQLRWGWCGTARAWAM